MRFLFILLLLFPSVARSQAIEFPNPPTGQVFDTGAWLGHERKSRLEKELSRYRSLYSLDVMVILWDYDLPPATTIEELADRLGRMWARETLWAVVIHVPDSVLRPTAVFGGQATTRFAEEAIGLAVHDAQSRAMKERTTTAQVEALALELGEEFVFLRNRAELEQKEQVAHQQAELLNKEERHQSMIFRAVIATLLALLAVGVVAILYMIRRRPNDLHFPETRWRNRLGAPWSGGGQPVVAIPPRI